MFRHALMLCCFVLATTTGLVGQAIGAEPKMLFDPRAADAASLIALNGNSQGDVTYQINAEAIDVAVNANSKTGYPGIVIKPSTPWNASGYGRIEAKITNNGAKRIRINLRVDNEGNWQTAATSSNVIGVDPGKSVVATVILGYQYGKPVTGFQSSAIKQLIIFTSKMDTEQKFRVEAIRAAGEEGEKPYIDPNTIATKPAGGVLLGGNVTVDSGKQLIAKGGAKAALASDGKSIQLSFTGQNQSVDFKPAVGMWNLRDHLQMRIKMKNTGAAPITPSVQLLSRGGSGDSIPVSSPIAPGATTELVVPFMAQRPWEGADLPEMKTLELKRDFHEFKPGTGTRYTSNTATGMTIRPDSAAAHELQITSIIADLPARQPLPDWLGKRPPVEGDWTKTFDDNFDGSTIDLKRWNIYTEGEWHLGANTHYTKENVIVKDGKLHLRIEKKRGFHNDNPKMVANDYATGYADTYGKWTQRYGYFESRLKIPTAPNTFFAFWMMPDRGIDAGPQYVRAETKKGGMEFDIMEGLSIWGPYRHDFGMHWDSYQKYHKSTGTLGIYFMPDEEGFITVGMLWLPGQVIMYNNGVERARWETQRIGSIQSYLILDNITGGWETETIDDTQWPADLVVDYVRAWQRNDLATPEDGAKPNDGGPLPPTREPANK